MKIDVSEVRVQKEVLVISVNSIKESYLFREAVYQRSFQPIASKAQ